MIARKGAPYGPIWPHMLGLQMWRTWLAGDRNGGGPRAERFPAGWISFHHNSPSYSAFRRSLARRTRDSQKSRSFPATTTTSMPAQHRRLSMHWGGWLIHSFNKLLDVQLHVSPRQSSATDFEIQLGRLPCSLVRRIHAEVNTSWSFPFGRSCRYLKFRALVTNHNAT